MLVGLSHTKGTLALLADDFVVFSMSTNPYPHDAARNFHSERPVMNAGADRPQITYPFEM